MENKNGYPPHFLLFGGRFMYTMEYYNSENKLKDLSILAVGEQYCAPEHFNGPKVREPILFHFVFSGKGIFKTHGKTYELHGNQGFIISDTSPVYYKADKNDPWHYGWVLFTGKTAQSIMKKLRLSSKHPIYTAIQQNNIYNTFKKLLIAKSKNNELDSFANFFSYISTLVEHNVLSPNNQKTANLSYAQKAEEYIRLNYHLPLRIQDVANYVAIDRSYLTRIFVEKFGKSPQEYLLQLRMEKAKTLLQNTNYMVQTVAELVGYQNIESFTKIYKKHYGYSPSQTKRK